MASEAAVHVLDESHIFLFLVQFLLLLGLAKLLGALFVRFRQPTVTADILVGVLLGPSILGRLFPAVHRAIFPADPFQITMLDTVAWLGIFFLLLVTGLEVNFSSIWRQKGKALWIALADIIIPIVLSGALIYFLPDRYLVAPERRLLFTLFIGTIMTISAMPVSIRVMDELKLMRTDLGFLTISALSINDVIGWVVFTIILGAFTRGAPDLAYVGSLALMTGLLIALVATVGRRGVDALISLAARKTKNSSGYALTIVSMAGFAVGAVAQRIGIHALFGFFLAGLAAGEARDLTERTRATISQIVYAVFVPVFFANIGLKIDMLRNFDLFLVLLFTIVGIGARFFGAYVGAVLARTPKVQRWPVAALHTPGGEMHIVIAALALELQLVNQTVFVGIIIAAILSSVTLGPWLSFMLKRIVPKETLQLPADAALELTARDSSSALRELCDKAAIAAGAEATALYESARIREEGMSTALEYGVAIPHARVAGAKASAVVLGRSKAGIDWNSPDGAPARLVFFIATPHDESDNQLQLYRQIVSVVMREDNRNGLIEASTPRDAVTLFNETLRITSVSAS